MESLDQLFPELDPYEEEPEDDEGSETDVDALAQVYASLGKAVANHYHRVGAIPEPDSFMPVAWHLEMGPSFAEAEAEANLNAEGADASALDVSVDAYSGELGAEAGTDAGAGEGAGDSGGESGGGGGPSIEFDFGDFGGGNIGGDFGGFGGGGL